MSWLVDMIRDHLCSELSGCSDLFFWYTIQLVVAFRCSLLSFISYTFVSVSVIYIRSIFSALPMSPGGNRAWTVGLGRVLFVGWVGYGSVPRRL